MRKASVCVVFSWPESTVYVKKAPSWASIKLFSAQCLSLLETLMEICFCWRSSMSLLSPDGRKEKGRSEWAAIVLCSRHFTHTLPHTFAKPHTHTHSLLAPLQWNQCSQFCSVCKASCGAKGFLWSNATSSSATSDTDVNTARLLCSGASLHLHCVESI